MKQFFRLLALLLILGSAPCRAENDTIVHNFPTLVSTGDITFTKNAAKVSNGVGTVSDGVVYTCTGKSASNSAAFGMAVSGSEIGINLQERYFEVTTTQISNLKEVRMRNTLANGSATNNLIIKLSTDGSVWGEDLPISGTGMKGVSFSKGNYYVKIYNSVSTPVSITELRFVTEPEDCNCFVYTP